jgi:hypothetical protein
MYQGGSVNKEFQAAMEDLFYNYGVDVYFSGHVHSYERDYPVGRVCVTTMTTAFLYMLHIRTSISLCVSLSVFYLYLFLCRSTKAKSTQTCTPTRGPLPTS